MSAIFGRINFDNAPIDTDHCLTAFSAIEEYGGDGSGIEIDGSLALGHHLLEITPESAYEKQPYRLHDRLIVADCRIDNREELFKTLDLDSAERDQTPDSHLILRAYLRWGEACTAHLLGDYAFAIWDPTQRRLFCARDHIGARPFYYYFKNKNFIFATDIRAIIAFPDVDRTLDESEIASYLVWPYIPREKSFFQHIYMLPFAQQMTSDSDGIRRQTHWHPEDAPDIRYSKKEDYFAHYREILESAVAARVRTHYPVGSHISGGLDSSGVAILANRALRKTGRSLTMTYTWSPPKSEAYPPMQGDERDRIETICAQEGIPCHYGTSTLQDFIDYLGRDTTIEGIANVFQELPVVAHAGAQKIRVLLSGWGGDEVATFSGLGYAAQLLKQGNIIRLMKILRKDIGGLKRFRSALNYFFQRALLPNMPDMVYKYFDYMNNPFSLSNQKRYLSPRLANQFPEVYHQRMKAWKSVPNVRTMQHLLLENGHITSRMETWAVWSSSHRLVHSYPLVDQRLIEYSLGLPNILLNQDGRWRQTYVNSLKGLLPIRLKKSDQSNEKLRNDLLMACWVRLATECRDSLLGADPVDWLDTNTLTQDICNLTDDLESNENRIKFMFLITSLSVLKMAFKYKL